MQKRMKSVWPFLMKRCSSGVTPGNSPHLIQSVARSQSTPSLSAQLHWVRSQTRLKNLQTCELVHGRIPTRAAIGSSNRPPQWLIQRHALISMTLSAAGPDKPCSRQRIHPGELRPAAEEKPMRSPHDENFHNLVDARAAPGAISPRNSRRTVACSSSIISRSTSCTAWLVAMNVLATARASFQEAQR
jgi:hypothetical protein